MERVFSRMMDFYAGDPHQIQHFTKVHNFAHFIGLGENLDDKTRQILELAAIVHDIGIKPALEKYGSAKGSLQEAEGPPLARKMLSGMGFSAETIERVCYLVGHHHTYENVEGLDYQILIEADFLVNMFEGKMDIEQIKETITKIFRTKTGTEYCIKMFINE